MRAMPGSHYLAHICFIFRVANHMGNQQYGDWNNFSFFVPFNQQQYYHPYCLIQDFNNQTEVLCSVAIVIAI